MKGIGEFKFRAWDFTSKEMIYSDDFGSLESFFAYCRYRRPPFQLLESTGLKDKNGKDGYDKDYCQHPSGLYLIEWIAIDAKFVLIQTQEGVLKDNVLDMRYLGQMEITGNIYKKPELSKR